MKLLDLFCCQGGCGMGYHRAGFEVTGVDIEPQPRYPFTFHQADALEFLAEHGHEYDAIHASPTCQRKARVTAWRGNREGPPEHPHAHPRSATRHGDPVRGGERPRGGRRAPRGLPALWHPVRSADTQAPHLRAWLLGRLRTPAPPCNCYRRPDLKVFEHKDERAFADAMGCEWMSSMGGRQAIPPAYTEFIGHQLINHLAEVAA